MRYNHGQIFIYMPESTYILYSMLYQVLERIAAMMVRFGISRTSITDSATTISGMSNQR
jgi:hypothetical protein